MTVLSAPQTQATQRDAAWLDAHWMPFTGNRNFKADPRMVVSAKGAYFTDADGRKIFDGLSGLWCTGLGHGRAEISEAVARQVAQLDYAPAFQFGHPGSFALANKIRELTPAGLDAICQQRPNVRKVLLEFAEAREGELQRQGLLKALAA